MHSLGKSRCVETLNSPAPLELFPLNDKITLVLIVHFVQSSPSLHITFTPCQSHQRHHLHCLLAHLPLGSPPTNATSLPPCSVCLSLGMKRKCLPVGSQVAHPKGWLRLMSVIQLCWFTPHIHRGVGDYTVLCWRGREADRWNRGWERERERWRVREWERDRCHVADEALWALY